MNPTLLTLLSSYLVIGLVHSAVYYAMTFENKPKNQFFHVTEEQLEKKIFNDRVGTAFALIFLWLFVWLFGVWFVAIWSLGGRKNG